MAITIAATVAIITVVDIALCSSEHGNWYGSSHGNRHTKDISAVTPAGTARVNYILTHDTNSARVQGACYSRHIFSTALT